MTGILTRRDLESRVPASVLEQAIAVCEAAPALELIEATKATGWTVPLRMINAADALVRAGVLRQVTPLRYRVADSREVVL